MTQYEARHPFDVHFFFPDSNRHLWGSSDFLRAQSSYWNDLLSSGFEEGSKSSDKDRQKYNQNESSTKTTELTKTTKTARSKPAHASCQVPYHRIEIREKQPRHFETFAALISEWAASTFTPSMHPSHQSATKRTLWVRMGELRWATRLWQSDLGRLFPSFGSARARLPGDQESNHVATELFSSFAASYEEVYQFELECCVEEWNQVKKSPGMAAIQRRIAARDPGMEGAASTLFELMMRVSDR
ncbi:BQ2448_2449 [Microbotryum intermedium]|uniref:BQ2448_2449 protein n=1 Tax=Microbotryum intermedium TaxID=269621 RepID=A0A238F9K2_9BASI|nr:BQ2448_2449 [Microbotryum intermedium]